MEDEEIKNLINSIKLIVPEQKEKILSLVDGMTDFEKEQLVAYLQTLQPIDASFQQMAPDDFAAKIEEYKKMKINGYKDIEKKIMHQAEDISKEGDINQLATALQEL